MTDFHSLVLPPMTPSEQSRPLFERIRLRDPLSGRALVPKIHVLNPGGAPLSGTLRVEGTDYGYPIVDSVARLTPELAERYRDWLVVDGLLPPPRPSTLERFQIEDTVSSFGFQWSWNSAMRSDDDLKWRVASRFGLSSDVFTGRVVLDAGAGAGDQSRWLLDQGAEVVSIDLSAAIEVVARKLRSNSRWFGIQGDLMNLPLADDQFDVVYCEGVIQHTADSARTVGELLRVLRRDGTVLATHYGQPTRFISRMKLRWVNALRRRLSRTNRYKLLLLTGVFAALAYVPGIRAVMRKSGIATYYDLMPDFKTTWTNTFDTYGNHAFQRHVSPEEFWSYFTRAGGAERVYQQDTLVVARKT